MTFDFRPFQGEVEVLDIPPLATISEQVQASRTSTNNNQALTSVTGHACTSLVNGLIVSPEQPISQDADVVQFRLWADGEPVQPWRPFQFGDARPPAPLIPEDVSAVPTLPDARRYTGATSSRAAAIPRYAPVTRFAPEARYSYLDIHEGVQNRPKPTPGTDQACVDDAVMHVPRRGMPLSARIIVKPLSGLYTPQVLLSRVLLQSGWHTIAIDLRALNLGIKIANVRLGSSIRQLFAFDSPLRSELVDLGRGDTPLSFLLNLMPCVEDNAFHVRVDTLTVHPADAARSSPVPPSLSSAAPARWNRRFAPVTPDRVIPLEEEGAALFTVFDPVHHVRTFRRDVEDTDEILIAKAISVTPSIPDAEGFLLLHGVAELPAPQFVLKSSANPDWIVPLVFQQRPIAICTVAVPDQAIAFQVAYIANKACPALRGAQHQIARRTATIVGHHGSADPYRPGCVRMHEALVLQGFSANAARQRATQSRQNEAVTDWVEARHWDPHEDYSPLELTKVKVYVARGDPGIVHVDPAASMRNIKDYISVYSPIGPIMSFPWPAFCPAVPGAGPVVLAITQEANEEAANWALVDVRRVGHPPLRPFITIPLPPIVDLSTLLEVVRGELPSLRPISRVYMEDYRVNEAPRATGPVMTIIP